MEIVVIFIAFIGFAIFAAIHAHQKAKARIAALSAWAASKQLGFAQAKRHDFDDYHPQLQCLRRGSNRYAHNISSGQWGSVYTTAFDYHYETHSTDSKGNRQTHHHHYSCMLLKPEHPMKPLLIRREGLFDKIKAGFGFNDIDFESAEFSKKFFVTAKDKRWAYDVIHTRTMEMLLANQIGFSIECDHEALCVVAKKHLEPHGFEQAYHYGLAVIDGIPDYAKQNLAL